MSNQSILIHTALLFALQLLQLNSATAQNAGNVNYQYQYGNNSSKRIQTQISDNNDIVISAKGLSNIEADVYVAMFSATQTATTAAQVNELMDERIKKIKDRIGTQADVFVDMITFVPTYEFDITKKIFSKTYNEVPIGFELKKNLHIKYSNPELIHKIIQACAEAEVHELVKVDYISTKIDSLKKQLRKSVKQELFEKTALYKQLIGSDFNTYEKNITDNFKLSYPTEMYKSYKAYASTSLSAKRGKVNQVQKDKVLYYNPVVDKDFDVVINPVVFQPVIQLQYQVTLKIRREEKKEKTQKQFMLVTPTGEVKELKVGN